MPRLIPKKQRLMVATEDIPTNRPDSPTGFVARRGQVLTADNPTVRNHPGSFEPAPTDVRNGHAPPLDEVAAIAATLFTTSRGETIWPGTRLCPYDELVVENKRFFQMVAPIR